MLHLRSLFVGPQYQLITAQSQVVSALAVTQGAPLLRSDLLHLYDAIEALDPERARGIEEHVAAYIAATERLPPWLPPAALEPAARMVEAVERIVPAMWQGVSDFIHERLSPVAAVFAKRHEQLQIDDGEQPLFLGRELAEIPTPERAALLASYTSSFGVDLLLLGNALEELNPTLGRSVHLLIWDSFALSRETGTETEVETLGCVMARLINLFRAFSQEEWDRIVEKMQASRAWIGVYGLFSTERYGDIVSLLAGFYDRKKIARYYQHSDDSPNLRMIEHHHVLRTADDVRQLLALRIASTGPPERIPIALYEGDDPLSLSDDFPQAMLERAMDAYGRIPLLYLRRSYPFPDVAIMLHRHTSGQLHLYGYPMFDLAMEDGITSIARDWFSKVRHFHLFNIHADLLSRRISAAITSPPHLQRLREGGGSLDRATIDQALLDDSSNPRSVAFRSRQAADPRLSAWVSLDDTQGEIRLSAETVRASLRSLYAEALKDIDEFFAIWEKSHPLPEDIEAASDEVIHGIGTMLDLSWRKQELIDAEYERLTDALINLLAASMEYRSLRGRDEIVLTVSVQPRSDEMVAQYGIPAEYLTDVGSHYVVAKFPNGTDAFQCSMRLFEAAEGGLLLGYEHYTHFAGQLIPRLYDVFLMDEVAGAVTRIAGKIGIPESSIISTWNLFHRSWGQGTVAVTDPPGAQSMISLLLMAHRHPHATVFSPNEGNYELLRRDERGHVAFANPWINTSAFPFDLSERLLREIEPDPKLEQAFEYTLGFSGGTGRSVDFPLDHRAAGVRWRHLSAIGVGKTLRARGYGPERRDGKLPLEGAIRRFYFTNLMHDVAGPLGFRTSLGLAVVNRGVLRQTLEEILQDEKAAQIEAVVYELRREQLRLGDLSGADDPRAVFDFAKARVAEEFAEKHLTDEAYVAWSAKTLGEQFAIMIFFGFDHGEIDQRPQLHMGNISLAGEIFDFDTAGIQPAAKRRYFTNHGNGYNGLVDTSIIFDLQRRARGEEAEASESWVARLAAFAPGVDFYRVLLRALKRKRRELEESGFKPRKAIARFNREKWNPHFRGRYRAELDFGKIAI